MPGRSHFSLENIHSSCSLFDSSIASLPAIQGGTSDDDWKHASAFYMFPLFCMNNQKARIHHSLSGARAKAGRKPAGPEDIDMKFQKVFAGKVVRVSVSVPEPDGSHLILLECWLHDEWFPLGVIRDYDVLPILQLLVKAYEWMHPTVLTAISDD